MEATTTHGWRIASKVAAGIQLWTLIPLAVLAYSTYFVRGRPLPSWVGGALFAGAVFAALLIAAATVARVVTGTVLWWTKGRARWDFLRPSMRRLAHLDEFDAASRTLRHGQQIIRVSRVYQTGRRGTKCVIEHPWGQMQDAWFWSYRPRGGHVYIVSGGTSWGTHHHGNVLYINSVDSGLRTAAWSAARRRAHRGMQ